MPHLNLILEKVENHVLALFENNYNPLIIYHNIFHTRQVVKACIEIGNAYKLRKEEYFILITAAWFHDTGYADGVHEHEKRGAVQAENFLKKERISDPAIVEIKNCILATKLPQQPKKLLEEIICDADLFHFGNIDFAERSQLMHKETEGLTGEIITIKKWKEKTLQFLEAHQYFTDYCKKILAHQKKENILKLKNEIECL